MLGGRRSVRVFRAIASRPRMAATSAESRIGIAPRQSNSLQNSPRGSVGNHGNVAISRPKEAAWRAVMAVPLRDRASITQTPSASAAISRFLFSKCHGRISVSGEYSDRKRPPDRNTGSRFRRQSFGYGRRRPVGSTTAVGRDSPTAIAWANSSIPRAPPLTMAQ